MDFRKVLTEALKICGEHADDPFLLYCAIYDKAGNDLVLAPQITAFNNFNKTYRLVLEMKQNPDPRKILARTKDYIMEPEEGYETEGLYNGCVFPTGNVVKGGILYVYYGCADKYVSLATANFDELVDYLWTECREK